MRKVFCSKYKQELDGLDVPPFPGDVGKRIYENVSKQAWQEWQDLQIKIINEYRLNLSLKEDYEALRDQMLIFLGLKEGMTAEVGDPEKGK